MTPPPSTTAAGRFAGLALAVLLAAGCATTKVDWAARVGSFSYDQAVSEMGPPDKSATLADGTLVTEWLVRRGYTHTTYYPHHSFGYGHISSSTFPDSHLRLTFGPDRQLKAWKRVYQ